MPTNRKIIEIAREDYNSDDIEIDDDPIVSRGKDGYWVSAWVFVVKDDDRFNPKIKNPKKKSDLGWHNSPARQAHAEEAIERSEGF
jgi:hypothetical protein